MQQLKFNRFLTSFAFLLILISLVNFDEAFGRSNNFKKSKRKHRKSSRYNNYRSFYPRQALQQDDQRDKVIFETNFVDFNVEKVHISCDLLEYGGDGIKILNTSNSSNTYRLDEVNIKNDTRHPWMSCRFIRVYIQPMHVNKIIEWTPPKTPNATFDPYLNISLSGVVGTGNTTTYIYLNDTGIFSGRNNFLSQWGVANKTNFSTNPRFKLMNSITGGNCDSICIKMTVEVAAECMVGSTQVHQPCTPRNDYNIRDYGYNRMLSNLGLPCISECHFGNKGSRPGFLCKIRQYVSGIKDDTKWCSPAPGTTYQNDTCTGPCIFNDNYAMTCNVRGMSLPQPCSTWS